MSFQNASQCTMVYCTYLATASHFADVFSRNFPTGISNSIIFLLSVFFSCNHYSYVLSLSFVSFFTSNSYSSL